MTIRIDVSPLVPEAGEIVARVAAMYFEHTQPWFIGLLIHGSALKGGFIPNCSDIDFQLYLDDGAFDANGNLLLEVSIAIQRDLSSIDIAPFHYVQCYVHRSHLSTDPSLAELGPIPGAYHMLVGVLPIPEATVDQMRARAKRALKELKVPPSNVSRQLLDFGERRLERAVRLMCTEVGPTLYNVLTCQTNDPLHVWKLPKPAAIELLSADETLGREIRRFYESVRAFYSNVQSVEQGLETISQGAKFMQSAKDWYAKLLFE